MPTHQERIAGGLIGLLVGDALGVPYEFHDALDIPGARLIEYEPPPGFQRAHKGVPPGTWSDDGAHALCLLESLLERDRLDLDDLGRRLLAWYENGHLAVDGHVFDVGVQTSRALRNLRDGVAAAEAGPSDERANGNGSLMRVLPLALWHRGSDAELAADAARQSRVTHGHARSQACCALYVLWARNELAEVDAPWARAVATARTLWDESHPFREQLEFFIRPEDGGPGRGGGYVVDCLRSAVTVVEAPGNDSFEAVVKDAISLGDDTDTTACVAGGIAGLRYGIGGIPERWRENLRGRSLYEPLLERLLART